MTSERSPERFSDFDGHITPEEAAQDWIEWGDDFRAELEDFYADEIDPPDYWSEPDDIDDDRGMNPYDGTYDDWSYYDSSVEDDFDF